MPFGISGEKQSILSGASSHESFVTLIPVELHFGSACRKRPKATPQQDSTGVRQDRVEKKVSARASIIRSSASCLHALTDMSFLAWASVEVAYNPTAAKHGFQPAKLKIVGGQTQETE